MNKEINREYRVLIAGGGTGGHLFPAVAIGEELENSGFNVKYIGSKHGIESKFMKQDSIYLLDIKGIQRSLGINSIISNLLLPAKIIKSYLEVKKIFKQFKPDLVIGTGGYACALPIYAAIRNKILTALQEQNVIPGMITKKFHSSVDMIFTSFPETENYLSKNNLIYTGNPLRKKICLKGRTKSQEYSLLSLNLDPYKKTILIIGGSQGAKSINDQIIKSYKRYLEKDIQIIWQVGKYSKEIIKRINNKNIKIFEFIVDMDVVYSASDIVISRAGATAISEILYLEKPSILIPYPHAANNHQEINARVVESAGASIMVKENEFISGRLEQSIIDLMTSNNKINSMKENAAKMSKKNASKLILNEIKNRIDSARR